MVLRTYVYKTDVRFNPRKCHNNIDLTGIVNSDPVGVCGDPIS